MRAITSIILFSLLSNFAFTQELEGKYVDKTDYFYFNEGIAEFSIQIEGGLTYPIKGIGKYKLFDEYVVIHTTTFDSIDKKYYSKEEFKDKTLEQIIEKEIIAFKIIFLSKDRISVMLLPYGTIQKIITIDMLKKLEIEAKQKNFRLREFGKI